MAKVRRTSDDVVLFLLYWCTLQEVVLSIIYKLTGDPLLTNLLFYSKDFLMIALLFCALLKRHDSSPFWAILFFLAQLFIMFVFSTLGIYRYKDSAIRLFQGLRNFLILPCFILIGINISNKQKFTQRIIHEFFPFVVFCAFLGIVEFLLDHFIGTRNFWTSTIGYTNFLVDIKHQAGTMLYGLPGNFYGSYGRGYFAVKRLVGPWANPLTSAYSMAIPVIYYFVNFVSVLGKPKVKRSCLLDLVRFFVLLIAVFLTHTRLILLALVIVCAYYMIAFSKKKELFVIAAVIGLFAILLVIDWNSVRAFMIDGSTMGHIISVINSFTNMNYTLFGNGFSYIGIYGVAGATENAYLSLLGNVGLFGLFLCVYILAFCAYRSYKLAKAGNQFALVVFLSAILYLISGFVSEQLFAYTTIAGFYILLGANSEAVYHYENRN